MPARSLPLLAGTLFLAGCVIEVHTGPTRHEFSEFPREDVTNLRVNLRMGAGELRMRGGAEKLVRSDFTYNVDAWKPDVRYSRVAGTGDLRIEQPGKSRGRMGDIRYVWDVQLADDVPVDLTARLGAGEARLDLGKLYLRRVDVEMGVGELRMDLRGKPQHDYNVHVRGGVGEATVYVPRDVGIYATGSGGIGEIRMQGLRRQGNHWVNEAYNDAKVRIHVDIQGGIGQINVIAD